MSGTRERRPFPFHEFENHLEQHEIANIVAPFAAA
jgi:hypothetical protein